MNVLRSICTVFLMLSLIGCNSNDIQKGNRNLLLGDYERSIFFFSRVIDRNPESYYARLGLGKALLQQLSNGVQTQSLWNTCIVNLEAARSLKPDISIDTLLSAAWNQYAYTLLKTNDTSQALAALQKSIEYNRENASSLNLAGLLYFNKKQFQKAYKLFMLVVYIDTLSPVGYFNAGIVSWTTGNCSDARNLWKNALVKFPENDDLLYWTAMAEKTCPPGK